MYENKKLIILRCLPLTYRLMFKKKTEYEIKMYFIIWIKTKNMNIT